MIKKTYDIMITNELTIERFRKVLSYLSKCGDILKITDYDDKGWTFVKIDISKHKWQMFVGMLEKNLGIAIYRVGDTWFI